MVTEMKRYRVMINGRNFLLRFDDPEKCEKRCGFYVTRDVEAESIEDAELKAVDLIRGEESIREITLNSKDDPPLLFLEEIRELSRDEESLNGSGYVYYPENDDSNEESENSGCSK